VAVVGGSLVLVDVLGRRRRVVAPFVALGAMSLTFYVAQFAYLDTLWLEVKPHLRTTLTYFLASVAFWVVFAFAAQLWFRFLARGPIELLVNTGAAILLWPFRPAGPRGDDATRAGRVGNRLTLSRRSARGRGAPR
jgi:uncharacterized membrane protein YeiB